MFSKILRNRRNDKADSTLVTFIIVLPLFFMFLITIIDSSVYFANRAVVQQIARDGARTTAIFGGAGSSIVATPLEKAYGSNVVTHCEDPGYGITVSSPSGGTNGVECNVIKRLTAPGAGLINVKIISVNCGPGSTPTVGSSTYCEIKWNYGGIPGSAYNFISAHPDNKAVQENEGDALFRVNTTKVTSESEVSMDASACVTRSTGAPRAC